MPLTSSLLTGMLRSMASECSPVSNQRAIREQSVAIREQSGRWRPSARLLARAALRDRHLPSPCRPAGSRGCSTCGRAYLMREAIMGHQRSLGREGAQPVAERT